MSEKTRRRVICGVSLGLFAAGLAVLTVLLWDKLTAFARDPAALRESVSALGWRGGVLFVWLMALQVVLAVIPGHPFEVAGGYCFGVAGGLALTSLGALLGSAAAFGLARLFGARAVTAFYSPEKVERARFLQGGEKQAALAFLAFLVPGLPKDMLAYFLGVTKMRFGTFLLVSTLGRLPGIFLAVLGGTALETRRTRDVVLFFVCFALAVVAIAVWRVWVRRKKSAPPTDTPKIE